MHILYMYMYEGEIEHQSVSAQCCRLEGGFIADWLNYDYTALLS
jgi:hypothetical protein